MTRASRYLLLAAFTLHAGAARAQSAEAEVLFSDGRALIKDGKLAAGCDKLAASEKIETSIGTLLNLGDCREKLGQYATAWAAFRKAEAMAKRAGDEDKRQAEARKRAFMIEAKIPYLAIEVPKRVDGIVVKRDGQVVDAAVYGTALPVDPGKYTIVVDAPGYRAWRTTVELAAGGKRRITVPALSRDVAEPEPTFVAPRVESVHVAPPVLPARVVAVEEPVIVKRPSSMWTTTRKVSVATGVFGIGALVGGVYFGFDARQKSARSDQLCPTTICANSEALRLNAEAQTSATRANVAYAVGGAAVVGAAVMWFVGAPKETVVTPSLSTTGASVSLTGRF